MFFFFSSVQPLSCVWLFVTHGPQHFRPPSPSPTPRLHPNSSPLSWWCHTPISSSVVPFSFCPKSFPASGYFPRSQQSWAENGTTMINLQGRDWFIIENMYKISILLQTICNWTTTEFVFIHCYICMLYTPHVNMFMRAYKLENFGVWPEIFFCHYEKILHPWNSTFI